MVQITKRAMTPEEQRMLLDLRPSFLFTQRRKVAHQELDAGLIEVLDLEVLRAWDINGCAPPCCPHIYLFHVGDGEYVYAESWTAFNFQNAPFPRRRLEIVRSPVGKRILSAKADGEVMELEDSLFDSATDYFSLPGDSECEIVRAEDMPQDVWSILSAT